jgi:hypothetical protein
VSIASELVTLPSSLSLHSSLHCRSRWPKTSPWPFPVGLVTLVPTVVSVVDDDIDDTLPLSALIPVSMSGAGYC